MKNTDIIILTAVLTILSVALLGCAYFLGEARVASLVQQTGYSVLQAFSHS